MYITEQNWFMDANDFLSLISRGDSSSHRNRPTAASKPDEAQPSLVCWLQWAC